MTPGSSISLKKMSGPKPVQAYELVAMYLGVYDISFSSQYIMMPRCADAT